MQEEAINLQMTNHVFHGYEVSAQHIFLLLNHDMKAFWRIGEKEKNPLDSIESDPRWEQGTYFPAILGLESVT